MYLGAKRRYINTLPFLSFPCRKINDLGVIFDNNLTRCMLYINAGAASMAGAKFVHWSVQPMRGLYRLSIAFSLRAKFLGHSNFAKTGP